MTQESLDIFVDSATRHFERATKTSAVVQTPYLQAGEADLLDYSAVIGVSGHARGCVYYTAQRGLLSRMLRMQGESDQDQRMLCDTVGEMANIISGNARKQLGSGFVISVPVVLEGNPKKLSLPMEIQSFVIPITWMGFQSVLIVCLQPGSGNGGAQ